MLGATIGWNPSDGALQYRVCIYCNGALNSVFLASQNGILISGVVPVHVSEIRVVVSALNDCGESQPSFRK
jgi:hypothetical protein